MALRNLRINEDPILRKKSREITEVNDRIKELEIDMIETMYHSSGVGLAAPQVGVLKRIVVVDIGEGPITMLNPIIVGEEGSVIAEEACLSFPDDAGKVERPASLIVEYQTMEMKKNTLSCEGLMARAVAHEVDHINGIVFLDRVIE